MRSDKQIKYEIINKRPIYLCGFMGCGKSTVGRRLAEIVGYNFVDLDRYIEKHSGMTIAEIFNTYGEEHFRKLESEYIGGFQDGVVVALGGGAILREENAVCANSIGEVVLIDTKFEMCYRRISGDIRRPIAYNLSEEQLRALYNTRMVKYKAAASIVINGNEPQIVVAKNIAKALINK